MKCAKCGKPATQQTAMTPGVPIPFCDEHAAGYSEFRREVMERIWGKDFDKPTRPIA